MENKSRNMITPDITSHISHGSIRLVAGKVTYFDDAYSRLFGFSSVTELMAFTQSPLELITNGYEKKITDISLAVAQERAWDPTNGEVIFTTNRFGRTIALFVLIQCCEESVDKAINVLAFDISKKVSPHQLINKPKYESLINKSSQGVVIHRFFKPLLINQAWANMMKIEDRQKFMESGNILDFIPESLQSRALERYEGIVRGDVLGESHIIENIRSDGERRFFNVYDHAIYWEGEPALEVVIVDVTEDVYAQRELAFQAKHDALTGLFNRTATYQWLDSHYTHADSMVCILIDVDNFKVVNDSYGHQMGDKVLKALAKVFLAQVPDRGTVARWGGEEFILFIPNASPEEAMLVAEEIRLECEALVHCSGEYRWNTTLSIGISRTEELSSVAINKLLRQADKNMYQAKVTGKNRSIYKA